MHTKFSRISTIVMVLAAITLTSCATRTSDTDLYGIPVPANDFADYSITIGPNTKYVNVVGGEIVRFVINDKSFVWHFMVASTVGQFDLTDVAPAGMLDHSVIAYVKPDPLYIGVP